MFTSNFNRAGRHMWAISIALSCPKWYIGKAYYGLMPTWDLVKRYRFGSITKEQYIDGYMKLLEKRNLDPIQVSEELGNGVILLCWEPPEQFCHRHLVAKWFEDGGISCTELMMGGKSYEKEI